MDTKWSHHLRSADESVDTPSGCTKGSSADSRYRGYLVDNLWVHSISFSLKDATTYSSSCMECKKEGRSQEKENKRESKLFIKYRPNLNMNKIHKKYRWTFLAPVRHFRVCMELLVHALQNQNAHPSFLSCSFLHLLLFTSLQEVVVERKKGERKNRESK